MQMIRLNIQLPKSLKAQLDAEKKCGTCWSSTSRARRQHNPQEVTMDA